MTTIQIRDVPDEVSRRLKSRAAEEGRSLSDYLLRELSQLSQRPTRSELLARLDQAGRLDLPPAADVLTDERDRR